jgi:hypothetical protein
MIHCTACNRETRPYAELDPGRGMVRKCGHADCKAGLPAEDSPAAVAAISLALAVQGKRAEREAPSVTVRDDRVVSPPAINGGHSEPRSLDTMLADIRARLTHVRARLKELDALAAEERRLSRALLALESDAEIN